jgi:hypothetical protein
MTRRTARKVELVVLDLAVPVPLRDLRRSQARLRAFLGAATAHDHPAVRPFSNAKALARGANFAGGSVRGHDLILGPN